MCRPQKAPAFFFYSFWIKLKDRPMRSVFSERKERKEHFMEFFTPKRVCNRFSNFDWRRAHKKVILVIGNYPLQILGFYKITLCKNFQERKPPYKAGCGIRPAACVSGRRLEFWEN